MKVRDGKNSLIGRAVFLAEVTNCSFNFAASAIITSGVMSDGFISREDKVVARAGEVVLGMVVEGSATRDGIIGVLSS